MIAVIDRTEAQRGVTLPCPRCGEREAAILLNLADVETCTCGECEEGFDLGEVREFIERWGKVLNWIDAFPK